MRRDFRLSSLYTTSVGVIFTSMEDRVNDSRDAHLSPLWTHRFLERGLNSCRKTLTNPQKIIGMSNIF